MFLCGGWKKSPVWKKSRQCRQVWLIHAELWYHLREILNWLHLEWIHTFLSKMLSFIVWFRYFDWLHVVWCPNENRRWIKWYGQQSNNTYFCTLRIHFLVSANHNFFFGIHPMFVRFARRTVALQSYRFFFEMVSIKENTSAPFHQWFYSRQQNCHNKTSENKTKNSSIIWWTNRCVRAACKRFNVIGHHIWVICCIFDAVTCVYWEIVEVACDHRAFSEWVPFTCYAQTFIGIQVRNLQQL